MTQIFKKTLLTSLVLFLMTACSDDKKELKIIVEPTSFHFEQTGGSKKFGITPNAVSYTHLTLPTNREV